MSDDDLRDRLARLESLVEQQQETIEEQRERIAEFEDESNGGERDDEDGTDPATVTRRGALAAGGLLALLGIGAGTASADPQGQIGTSSNPLDRLYTDELYGNSGTITVQDDLDLSGNTLTNTASINGSLTGNTEITDLVGSGLTITSGSLETIGGGGEWSDGDTDNLLEPSNSNMTGIEAVQTIQAGAGNALMLNTDGGTRTLALAPGSSDISNEGSSVDAPNVVGGHPNNSTSGSPKGAVVGGGGQSGNPNEVRGNYATVPGGAQNTAAGQYSLAAGRRAKADFSGNFVWADSTDSDFTSTGADQFLVQAGGGAGIGTTSPSTQLDVDGAVTASDGYRGNVGGAAYLGTNQTVSGESTETIQFDGTEADQRSEFDTNTGEFVCKFAGDYAVDVSINMSGGSNAISGGDEVHVNIAVNSLPRAEKVYNAPQGVVDPTITVSRTVYGLAAGETITAELYNTTSGNLDVYGGASKWTWMTVRQVA